MYQLAEEQAIRRLRGLWLHAFVLTAAAIVLGASLGLLLHYLAGPFPAPWRLATQYVGVGLVLLSVIGRAGWAFQTMAGTTLHEKVNDWWYLALNFLGALILSAGINWPATYA